MARVNILQRVKTQNGWTNVPLVRTPAGRIRWPSGGRFFIEWRLDGRRLRHSAGDTPSDARPDQRTVTKYRDNDLSDNKSAHRASTELDEESVSALSQFFLLLDKWDREAQKKSKEAGSESEDSSK